VSLAFACLPPYLFGADREAARMETGANNMLRGRIKSITARRLVTEILVEIGGQELVSIIDQASAERLALRAGDLVVVSIKPTEVGISR